MPPMVCTQPYRHLLWGLHLVGMRMNCAIIYITVDASRTCTRVSVSWVGDGSVGDFAYKNGVSWASWVN